MMHTPIRRGFPDTTAGGIPTAVSTDTDELLLHEQRRAIANLSRDALYDPMKSARVVQVEASALLSPHMVEREVKRAPTSKTVPHAPQPRLLLAVLEVPLVWKLVGANAVVLLAAAGVALGAGWRPTGIELLADVAVVLAALAASVGLVVLALRPLRTLEAVGGRVWAGDFAARVPVSALADRDMARLSRTFNLVLDAVTSDRTRMRRLASATIRAGDEERSRISAELHDSAAQSIAGLTYQLSALAHTEAAAPLSAELECMRASASEVLEQVRLLAQLVHPRVLDDLGLAAALAQLVRELQHSGGAMIIISAEEEAARRLSIPEAAALYRVARESLGNALRHSSAKHISVILQPLNSVGVRLVIEDDGRGFDLDRAEDAHPLAGIFTMRERMSLVGGSLILTAERNKGTHVVAEIPAPAADIDHEADTT